MPEETQLIPHDVWYWASSEGLARIQAMKPDLVVAGFPCQSVSVAAPQGQGLRGKSGVFEAVRRIVEAVRTANPDADFLLECTDFSQRHPKDWRYVSEQLGVEPVVICASRISACCRKRAYWASFEVTEPEKVEVDPNSVLDPGRASLWNKLPTIVASGQSSWNTREVVEDEWGEKLPLNIAEMERAMMFEEGYTEAEGLRMRDRFRLVGNVFHVGVLKHLMLCYVAHLVKRWSEDRDSARQRGSIFMENQDGPRPSWGVIQRKAELQPSPTKERRLNWGLLRAGTSEGERPNPNPNLVPSQRAGTHNWGAIPSACQPKGSTRKPGRMKARSNRPGRIRSSGVLGAIAGTPRFDLDF